MCRSATKVLRHSPELEIEQYGQKAALANVFLVGNYHELEFFTAGLRWHCQTQLMTCLVHLALSVPTKCGTRVLEPKQVQAETGMIHRRPLVCPDRFRHQTGN